MRAFEAAARLRSFVHAATELHVTPGAISHQIASLEAHLGVTLFERSGRSVSLTTAARAFLPKLTEGFAALRDSVADLDRDRDRRVLELSVAPGFASRWLLPRLPRFSAKHPDVDVRLSTGLGLVDPHRSGSVGGSLPPGADAPDLEVRFGRGDYPGRAVDRLFSASVTPVCSPALGVRAEGDLAEHSLLHDDTVAFDDDVSGWRRWLDAAGLPGIDDTRGPRFGHAALALDAAADGMGVALGLTVLIEHDLGTGRLVAPFELALPVDFAYFLVADPVGERPGRAAFRAWLLEEAALQG